MIEDLTDQVIKRYLEVSRLIHERFGSDTERIQRNIELRRNRTLEQSSEESHGRYTRLD